MNNKNRNAMLFIVAVLVALLTVLGSVSILPPAPIAPTPTWPLGIDLPNTLHRISPP